MNIGYRRRGRGDPGCSCDLKQIVAFAEGFELAAIDEAQQIPDIGR